MESSPPLNENPTLPPPGYHLHLRFYHTDIIGFVKKYFFKRNPVIVFYWVFTVTILLFAILQFALSKEKITWVLYALAGLPLFILLIIPHELIHGIGYYLCGAKRVSYRAVLRKMLFYAIADGFLISKVPFVLLAIAPFAVINAILLFAALNFSGPVSAVFSVALLMHTGGCSGDFALISYFYTYWKSDPLTIDLEGSRESCFFLRQMG